MSIENWTLEKKLCRCCHAEGDFKNLAEPCFDSGYEEIYADMIKDCFFINVVPVPGLLSAATYSICEPCITSLQDASKFRKKVAECEAKFQELYSKNAIKIEVPALDMAVKEEPSDSCSEDDFLLADDSSDELPGEIDDDGLCDDERFIFQKNTEETVKKKPKKAPAKTTKAKKGKTKKIKEEPQAEAAEGPEGEKEKIEKKKKDYNVETAAYYTFNRAEDGTPKYTCTSCAKVFKSSINVIRHYRDIHLRLPSKCSICKIPVPQHLRASHREKEHGIPMPSCNACGKQFRSQFLVLDHQKIYHMGERMFTCKICNMKCVSRTKLKGHIIKHGTVRAYKCEYCEKSFKWKRNLKTHTLIHLDERRHVCSVCKEAFVQRASLTYHIAKRHPEMV